MAHKDIRISFEIEGCRFEAVGFLNEEEPPISGNEMLTRTNSESGMTVEDEEFLMEHFAKLPEELYSHGLITCRINHDGVSSLWTAANGQKKWQQRWFGLDGPWNEDHLVMRRLP